MKLAKQPNMVKGNKIQCLNFQMCPICYGCRAYDSRLEECEECFKEGIDGSNRNYNVCNTNLHESWKLNQMITKHAVEFSEEEEISFSSQKNGGK